MKAVSIPGEVLQRDDLSSDGKLLFAYILPMGRCTMSRELLRVRLGMSKGKVSKAIHALAELELVDVVAVPGGTNHVHVRAGWDS